MVKIVSYNEEYLVLQEVGDKHLLLGKSRNHSEALSIRQHHLSLKAEEQAKEDAYDNYVDYLQTEGDTQ